MDLTAQLSRALTLGSLSTAQKAFNPNQPRDSRGRWAAGPSDGGMAAYNSMIADNFNHPVAKFVQQHARACATDKNSFIGGVPHRCYQNATEAVLADDSLTYVEGYISVHGVPVAHAWTINEEGVVRDVTLGPSTARGVMGYYGVPIKRDFLLETLLESKHYGVLTGDERGRGAQRVVNADPNDVVAR